MPIPFFHSELHRPPIEGAHLYREHLPDKLNQARHLPLELVSGPACDGKRSLVSCWLEACNIPGEWVSLDENNNDLRLFQEKKKMA